MAAIQVALLYHKETETLDACIRESCLVAVIYH